MKHNLIADIVKPSNRLSKFSSLFLALFYVEGGVKGVRIPQYRVTIYRNTETAVTNGKKLTLLILQILLSNRNNTFMSVLQNQSAAMSSVR